MKLKPYQQVAAIVAIIVALADVVIVYDLWLAGSWLSSPLLAATKTAAFVLIFIGSLIAEMQELRRSTRWLLFGCVLILGIYQAVVNMVVNFYGAVVPPAASAFFETFNMSASQVKFWYATTDASVRTLVVIIMWLVTGIIWRGAAAIVRKEPKSRKGRRVTTPKVVDEIANGSTGLPEATPTILQAIEESEDGKINQTALAEELDISRQTIGNWLKLLQNQGAILTLPGRGKFALAEVPVAEMEMPTFE